jgi:ABC-2 type transport system ATP-binding protein
MPAISVREVRKRYGELVAVDGVSFEVEAGETFGILGPNGAGKTTTLEMIEGLTRPDSGELEVLGEPVWPDPTRVQRRIGVQLQSSAFFDYLTTTEMLELFCRFYGAVPPGRAAEVLDTVGLQEKARARVNMLSGGQKQRLAIALALMHEPDIVFLDEPTTGLDPAARRMLWEVIRAIAAGGRTVILTTHYLEEAEELCPRVAIMDAGRIVALDTPAALVRSLGAQATVRFRAGGLTLEDVHDLPAADTMRLEAGRFELVSRDPQATLVALIGLAESRGIHLEDLSVREATLDDVFLALTGRQFRERSEEASE